MTTKVLGVIPKKRHQSPAQLANLRPPWPPGVPQNPAPGESLKSALLRAMRKPLVKPPPDAPAQAHVVYATLKGAIDCEPGSEHLKTVWERLEGKVPQAITGPGGAPLLTGIVAYINVVRPASLAGEDLAQLPEGHKGQVIEGRASQGKKP